MRIFDSSENGVKDCAEKSTLETESIGNDDDCISLNPSTYRSKSHTSPCDLNSLLNTTLTTFPMSSFISFLIMRQPRTCSVPHLSMDFYTWNLRNLYPWHLILATNSLHCQNAFADFVSTCQGLTMSSLNLIYPYIFTPQPKGILLTKYIENNEMDVCRDTMTKKNVLQDDKKKCWQNDKDVQYLVCECNNCLFRVLKHETEALEHYIDQKKKKLEHSDLFLEQQLVPRRNIQSLTHVQSEKSNEDKNLINDINFSQEKSYSEEEYELEIFDGESVSSEDFVGSNLTMWIEKENSYIIFEKQSDTEDRDKEDSSDYKFSLTSKSNRNCRPTDIKLIDEQNDFNSNNSPDSYDISPFNNFQSDNDFLVFLEATKIQAQKIKDKSSNLWGEFSIHPKITAKPYTTLSRHNYIIKGSSLEGVECNLNKVESCLENNLGQKLYSDFALTKDDIKKINFKQEFFPVLTKNLTQPQNAVVNKSIVHNHIILKDNMDAVEIENSIKNEGDKSCPENKISLIYCDDVLKVAVSSYNPQYAQEVDNLYSNVYFNSGSNKHEYLDQNEISNLQLRNKNTTDEQHSPSTTTVPPNIVKNLYYENNSLIADNYKKLNCHVPLNVLPCSRYFEFKSNNSLIKPKVTVRDRILDFESLEEVSNIQYPPKTDQVPTLINSKIFQDQNLIKVESEIEESDSGVTDLNKIQSETDTESESFSELRKFTTYQRADTHSRLLRLIQNENDLQTYPKEEVQFMSRRRKIIHNVSITRKQNPDISQQAETIMQRRQRLSLPLKTKTSIDADNPSTPSSPLSPSLRISTIGPSCSLNTTKY